MTTKDKPIHEGTPSLAAALAVAAFGFIVLGGVTLVIFLVPEEIKTSHYIGGGITGLLALVMYPWQILDRRARRHILTDSGVTYRCGIISRFEVEVPYRNIQAVSVRQGIIQRVFGCGDVIVAAHGVAGPVTISHYDINSVCIRSIPDFDEVVRILRRKMKETESHGGDVETTR